MAANFVARGCRPKRPGVSNRGELTVISAYRTNSAKSKHASPLMLMAACTMLLSCGSEAEGQAAAANVPSGSLSTVPISLSAALADTPESPQGNQSCPFLTTATAISTVKTSRTFELREASNTGCVWNFNIGFEIKVTVEPAATATPIEKRLYNLDNPPLIKPQSGPGTDPAIAYDTTWKERPPRPYAFGFMLDGDYVFIRTTGVETSEEQLRRAADEIAQMLPDAPTISAATASDTSPTASQVCDIWSEAELAAVFEVQEGGNISSYPSNGKTCIASIFPTASAGNKISLDFIFTETAAEDYEFRKANGWAPVEFAGKRALLQEKEDQFGYATRYMAPMDGGTFALTVLSKDPEMKAKAELLFANALSRIGD